MENDTKEKFSSWMYNVRDQFKDKSKEEIIDVLNNTKSPFSVLMSQIVGDFNIGSVFRTANAFNAKELFYFGKKKIDRRGCVGVYNYTPITHLSSHEEILALKSKYRFVALEQTSNSVMINNYSWHDNSLIIIGEEGYGLTKEILDMCDDFVEIPMMGTVRSFNAAVAGSIAMYDFCNKKVF